MELSDRAPSETRQESVPGASGKEVEGKPVPGSEGDHSVWVIEPTDGELAQGHQRRPDGVGPDLERCQGVSLVTRDEERESLHQLAGLMSVGARCGRES